jgi:formate dehydrogenase iron-sulfur subunit
MCPNRVAAGKQTACAEICPTGATKFGERDELINEAQQRIRDNPGQYVKHIYGLNEVGGTSVLLLSGVPFDQFGYSADVPTEPMPLLTSRVLSKVPDVVMLGGVLLGGIWWITNRRDDVAAAEDCEKNSAFEDKKRGQDENGKA